MLKIPVQSIYFESILKMAMMYFILFIWRNFNQPIYMIVFFIVIEWHIRFLYLWWIVQVIWDRIDVVFLSPDRIQDLCIIFAIIVVFLVFFNTYIFQAGLVSLLIRKFKTTIIISILYLALSVGLHIWTMVSVLFHIFSKGYSLS